MFCYDGYGSDPENWKKVKCFSGFCVKIISSSNERRYCKTGSHATECIYDYISYEIKMGGRYVWVSTHKRGMSTSKIICIYMLSIISSREQDILGMLIVFVAMTYAMDLMVKSFHGFGYGS